MGKIMAVNISEKKGTQKRNVHSAKVLKEWGLEGDAHAGIWHRQVSLLEYEKIEAFKAKGAPVDDGAFGENLIVSGIELKKLPVGSRLSCGEILLEVTQIGKECHSGCEIYKIMGDCIMPREGIFARVLHGGVVTEGDEIFLIGNHFDEKGQAVMVDVSGKGSSLRIAVASGCIKMKKEVVEAIEAGRVKKGDVLGTARVAGIMACKKTWELIPLCHPLLLQKAEIDFEILKEEALIRAVCTVKTEGQTGVEMEALAGAATALLTIYDMCKALDRGMEIKDLRLDHKEGGKSGIFDRSGEAGYQ